MNTPFCREIEELTQAFSNSNSSKNISLQSKLPDEPTVEFLNLIEPLIKQKIDYFHLEIQVLQQKYGYLPFDPQKAVELFFPNIAKKLISIVSRTLVLELNIARRQNKLEGDTSQERFCHFTQQLSQPEKAIAILQEYPILARQVIIHLNHRVKFYLEFLKHLCTDWEKLQTTFSPNLGKLEEIEGDAGDSHREGRSVIIAKFSSGVKLVYKPRSLSIDLHFQELLKWLNERLNKEGNHPPFRTLTILNYGEYGWVEFVTPSGCKKEEEIQRFYQRQGAYLALLYILEATDFHSENLIASGEHPVLVDLESLFHPRIKESVPQSERTIINAINYSVLNIGILPQKIWSHNQSEGIDISGLGAKEGQITPYKVSYWEKEGTDEMYLNRKPMEMPTDENRPTLNGCEVNILDYKDFLLTGFTDTYKLLWRYKEELLSHIDSFANDSIRVIVRDTLFYDLLLSESYHPDLLRDNLKRDRYWNRLKLNIENSPCLSKIISAEKEDLNYGDIPIFTTTPNTPHIWTSQRQPIDNFLEEPSINQVKRRIQQFSEEDLEKQIWYICASLATLAMGVKEARWPNNPIKVTQKEEKITPTRLLKAACAIGDRLEWLSLQSGEKAYWIGINLVNERDWTLAPLSNDLYDGITGIVLFLAYLGAITKEQRYTKLAKAGLNTIRDNQEYLSIGGFSGLGGIIYTFTHLGMLWNEKTLLNEAEELVKLLPPLIEKDEQLDIIGGIAGCLGSLVTLYHCQPKEHILAVATQCGARLLAVAKPMLQGIGWLTPGEEVPLAGFSHGAAGIAWALLELAALTGEERFRQGAIQGINYERSVFRPQAGNWPILRNLEDLILGDSQDHHHHCMTAWCHGAPGIGLARLRSLPHLDTVKIRAEIKTAVNTTLAHGFGQNHSLCHGDLGNIELLLQAKEVFNEPKWNSQFKERVAHVLLSIEEKNWLCGVPLGVETPGLMTGIAGIGYGLLRLAAPKTIPCVLVLEPPKNTTAN